MVVSLHRKWVVSGERKRVVNLTGISTKDQNLKFLDSQTLQLIIPCFSFSGSQHKLPWFSRLYYFDGEINDSINRFNKSPFDYLFGSITPDTIGGYKYNKNYTESFFGQEVMNHFDQRKICIPRGWGVDIPAVVQTGIGLSVNNVLFYGKIISEQYTPVKPTNGNSSETSNKQSDSLIHTGSDVIDINQKTKTQSYSTYVAVFKIVFQEKSLSGKTLQLLLSSTEVYAIQQMISEKTNTNLPNNPLSTDLNYINHNLRFVFETFQGDKDQDGFYFGKAMAKLKGVDNDGNEVILSNLELPSAELFLHTTDWIIFSSLEASGQLTGLKNLLDANPYPEFSTDKLVSIFKTLRSGSNERVFTDNLIETITRLRRQYYGYWDKEGQKSFIRSGARFFGFEPFERAIPSADASFTIPFIDYLDMSDEVYDCFKYLLSSANENSLHDNPSPYIIDPSNKRIDLGHLLYGLDGLIRDYYNTDNNYKKLSFKTSNDFTCYIGDFPNAAAESRLYEHGYKNRFAKFYYPIDNDIERLYDISAPDADILSDVDAFGIYNLYRFFTRSENSNSSLLPLINNERKLTLDFLFEYYYDDNIIHTNDLQKYPVNANFHYRWLNFCRGFGKDGVMVEEPATNYITDENNSGYIAFQGFVKKNSVTQKYEWVADQINGDGSEHQSKAKIRERAEAFAHFWYQFNYDQKAIVGALLYGNYKDNSFMNTYKFPDLLKNKTTNKSIRFERSGKLSLNQALSEYIEDSAPVLSSTVETSATELDYVLDKFLDTVKTNFEYEKSLRGY